jgi:hypothetical protein
MKRWFAVALAVGLLAPGIVPAARAGSPPPPVRHAREAGRILAGIGLIGALTALDLALDAHRVAAASAVVPPRLLPGQECRPDQPREHRYAPGHERGPGRLSGETRHRRWRQARVPATGPARPVWVPGHYDRRGRWREGHWQYSAGVGRRDRRHRTDLR